MAEKSSPPPDFQRRRGGKPTGWPSRFGVAASRSLTSRSCAVVALLICARHTGMIAPGSPRCRQQPGQRRVRPRACRNRETSWPGPCGAIRRVGALGWMPYSSSVRNKRWDQERLTPLAGSHQVGVDATLRAGVGEYGHAALSNGSAVWRLHHRLESCAKPVYVLSCVDRVPSAAIERYRKSCDWLTTLATKNRVDADAAQLPQRLRGTCRIGASGRAGLEGFAAVAGRWPCWPLARAKVAAVRSIGSVMAKHA